MNANTKKPTRRVAQRGFSLVEGLLTIALGATIAAVAIPYFTKGSADIRAQSTADGMSVIISGVKDRFGSLGGYGGVTNANVISNTIIPKSFPINGTTINTPYGGGSTVAFAAADGNSTFTVTVTGLTSAACNAIAAKIDAVTTGIGAGAAAPAEGTLSNAATATTIKAVGGALDPAKTVTQCADVSNGVVQLIAKSQ